MSKGALRVKGKQPGIIFFILIILYLSIHWLASGELLTRSFGYPLSTVFGFLFTRAFGYPLSIVFSFLLTSAFSYPSSIVFLLTSAFSYPSSIVLVSY